jgi:hypothetical protein
MSCALACHLPAQRLRVVTALGPLAHLPHTAQHNTCLTPGPRLGLDTPHNAFSVLQFRSLQRNTEGGNVSQNVYKFGCKKLRNALFYLY